MQEHELSVVRTISSTRWSWPMAIIISIILQERSGAGVEMLLIITTIWELSRSLIPAVEPMTIATISLKRCRLITIWQILHFTPGVYRIWLDFLSWCVNTFWNRDSKILLRLHCSCDEKFYDCLHSSSDDIGDKVGILYFSFLGTKCFRNDYPIVGCKRYTQ